jgi:uncharacterized protein (TIGR00251 family)
MIEIQSHAAGAILPVKAQANARRDAICGFHRGMLKVAVSQPRDKGKANRAIQTVLCEQLGLKPANVELLSGAASPQKRFLVRGVDPQQLATRLSAVLRDRI